MTNGRTCSHALVVPTDLAFERYPAVANGNPDSALRNNSIRLKR